MKIIVAGSRLYDNISVISHIMEDYLGEITEVVSGAAKGVDACGERWAEMNNLPIRRFIAEWDRYGRAAGPIRNGAMADYADMAVVFYDPEMSVGSANMIEQMKKRGKPVKEIHVNIKSPYK